MKWEILRKIWKKENPLPISNDEDDGWLKYQDSIGKRKFLPRISYLNFVFVQSQVQLKEHGIYLIWFDDFQFFSSTFLLVFVPVPVTICWFVCCAQSTFSFHRRIFSLFFHHGFFKIYEMKDFRWLGRHLRCHLICVCLLWP